MIKPSTETKEVETKKPDFLTKSVAFHGLLLPLELIVFRDDAAPSDNSR
jgi:hypothetical protein